MTHKFLLRLGLIGLLAACAQISWGGVTVEDETLALLPASVVATVRSDSTFVPLRSAACKLIGINQPLSTVATVMTYFVTTANACGWGAAAGPIWLVSVSSGTTSIVLSTVGYSVDALNDVGQGMHNVKVGGGTAEDSAFVTYRYDGSRYKKIRKVSVK